MSSEESAAKIKVGLIGAGNVATHLMAGLQQGGAEVVLVYSRSLEHAQALANGTPGVIATDNLDFTRSPAAHVYLISVPDQAIPSVVAAARFPVGALVAHTSGTQPLSVLVALANVHTGVFYPLQTFSKEKPVDWARIPLCLEASDAQSEFLLSTLAHQLSQVVVPMPGDARKQLHLAAVFACNFANHLWGVAQEVMQQAQLPFTLLEPLLQETLAKALLYPPFAVQTGPAQRKDQSTVQTHLQLLSGHPQYQELYQVLTQSIQTTAAGRQNLAHTRGKDSAE